MSSLEANAAAADEGSSATKLELEATLREEALWGRLEVVTYVFKPLLIFDHRISSLNRRPALRGKLLREAAAAITSLTTP